MNLVYNLEILQLLAEYFVFVCYTHARVRIHAHTHAFEFLNPLMPVRRDIMSVFLLNYYNAFLCIQSIGNQ